MHEKNSIIKNLVLTLIISTLSWVLSFFLFYTFIFLALDGKFSDMLAPSAQFPSSPEYIALITQRSSSLSRLDSIPYPISFIFLLISYLTLDFGIDIYTGETILENMIRYTGYSIPLLVFSTIFTFLILFPILLIEYREKKGIKIENLSKIRFVIGISAIFLPLLFLFFNPVNMIKLIAFDLQELHDGNISPIYRSDINPIGVFILPVTCIGSISGIIGLITYSLQKKLSSALKVSIFTVFLADSAYELIFSWPGISRYLYIALMTNNFPVMLATGYLSIILTIIAITGISLISLFVGIDVDQQSFQKTSMNSLKKEIKNILKIKPNEMIFSFGLIIFLVFLIFVPLIAPFDPIKDNLATGMEVRAPPGNYLFGTNYIGNDIFSRMLYGLRSIGITAILAGTAALIGFSIVLFLPKYHEITAKLLSIPLIAGVLLFLSGGIAMVKNLLGFQNLPINDWFIPVMILLNILVIIPIGYMIGYQNLQDQECNIIKNIRQTFCIGSLVSIVLIEVGCYTGGFTTQTQLFLGNEIRIGQQFISVFPWMAQGPLLFLVLSCFILLAFAIMPISLQIEEKSYIEEIKPELVQSEDEIQISIEKPTSLSFCPNCGIENSDNSPRCQMCDEDLTN